MTAVAGSGITAMAHDPIIAKTAFFLSLITFTQASFLVMTKLFILFKEHYHQGMSEQTEHYPVILIILPITTILSIVLFRYGHFFDHQFSGHLPKAYFAIVTATGWAFMTWYLLFGLFVLKNYFKKYMFRRSYFDESQWALICPMVAYAVLGAFVYHTLLPYSFVLIVIAFFMIMDVLVLTYLMVRQFMAIKQRAFELKE